MIPKEEDKIKQGLENSVLMRHNPVKNKWRTVRLQSNKKNLGYIKEQGKKGDSGIFVN